MNEIFLFTKNSVYSLRSRIQLEKPSINTVQFGKNVENKRKKMGTRNLSMSAMQNIRQSGWFCKLITSCWISLLTYSF